jgi:hypothetical protein
VSAFSGYESKKLHWVAGVSASANLCRSPSMAAIVPKPRSDRAAFLFMPTFEDGRPPAAASLREKLCGVEGFSSGHETLRRLLRSAFREHEVGKGNGHPCPWSVCAITATARQMIKTNAASAKEYSRLHKTRLRDGIRVSNENHSSVNNIVEIGFLKRLAYL